MSDIFEINNLVWCRDLETDNLDVEVSVAVTLNENRLRQIPKDAQYLLFVTVNPDGVSKIEETALGSDKAVSILRQEELDKVKDYVNQRYYEEIVPGVIFTLNSNIRQLRSLTHDSESKENELRIFYLKDRLNRFERLSKSGMEERGSLVHKLEDASSRAKHGAKNKEIAEKVKDTLTK